MLTSDSAAVRSPVFSIDKTKLIYLENDIGGPHQQCSRLKMVNQRLTLPYRLTSLRWQHLVLMLTDSWLFAFQFAVVD